MAGCHSCVSIVVSCGAASCARAGAAAAAITTATKTPRSALEATRRRHLSVGVIRSGLGRTGRGGEMPQDILDHGSKSTYARHLIGNPGRVPEPSRDDTRRAGLAGFSRGAVAGRLSAICLEPVPPHQGGRDRPSVAGEGRLELALLHRLDGGLVEAVAGAL